MPLAPHILPVAIHLGRAAPHRAGSIRRANITTCNPQEGGKESHQTMGNSEEFAEVTSPWLSDEM